MIDTGTRTFYGVLREKLNWGGAAELWPLLRSKKTTVRGVLLCVPVCHNKSLVVSETINEYGLHPIKFREDAGV